MDTTPTAAPLARFRTQLYQTVLGLRRDALFELLDAVLTDEQATSLVRHSLAPVFRRGWASAPDALSDGRLDVAALRDLLAATMPDALVDDRRLWVLDGTIWPRPAAKTSEARTWGRWTGSGLPESGIVGAWEYQWLVVVPEEAGSWVLPLDVGRRGPAAGTATTLAIAQVRAAQAARPGDAPRPRLLLDSHYDVPALVHADLGLDLLARLASNRRFYRAPTPRPSGPGAPRKHGPVFRCADPTTHGVPDRSQTDDDPTYGQVMVAVWRDLHTQQAPIINLTVLRVTLARLPRREQPPQPLWLVWHGGSLPDDLRTVWHWYQRRFAVEHAFRFLKQHLGWTTIRPRAPQSADRWSWLLAAGLWQLWLARELVAETRLPWERSQPLARRSPGRVRRGFAGIVLALGTPARPPRPRGKSPGRRRAFPCSGAPRRRPLDAPALPRSPPRPAALIARPLPVYPNSSQDDDGCQDDAGVSRSASWLWSRLLRLA